ncbi:MAG: S9 family peptidase [Xanthomonadales bacterium]|nr:S9 family peptidase [Xanthomonadales bacterium]
MNAKNTQFLTAAAAVLWLVAAPAMADRLTPEHINQLATVSDPQISPEGEWIAYVVERDDIDEDEARSRVWMVPAESGDAVAMTAGDESSSHPRWSPDGRYLAFLSARDEAPTQVWLLARHGGEAVQLSDTPQSVSAFEWSPDSSRMLLVLQDASEAELAAHEGGEDYEEEAPPPWVIDRLQFKEDYTGYLDRRRTHIYILDIESKALTQVTSGDHDDSQATWSPDGTRIAFTSNRTDEPDSNYNTDIWVVPAGAGQEPVQVTANPGADGSPAWSPDGKHIAHTVTNDIPVAWYATANLAVTPADGGETRLLTQALDRNTYSPKFSPDGRHIWFMLEDSGEQILARVRASGGNVERMVSGQDVVYEFEFGPKGRIAALVSRPHLPSEVFLYADGRLEQRSFANREMLAPLTLGEVREVQFKSADGTDIEGFVILPPGFEEGKRYPAVLDIHGGPQSQYDWSFHFEGQIYAAAGYVVVHPNPRGSTGYGQDFCMAIWQDWGGPDYEDVMAAVDQAIEAGWADGDRLGVVGWSYGGILTNHVITKTGRFKAAVTGASDALYITSYGHDMYQRWWEYELGYPWEEDGRARYDRISPYYDVEKVTTPTLVMGGEVDWNVPIHNSEQLYLALKKVGVDTQLVVYPDEYHGISRPSYKRDLYQRYLGWLGERLQ